MASPSVPTCFDENSNYVYYSLILSEQVCDKDVIHNAFCKVRCRESNQLCSDTMRIFGKSQNIAQTTGRFAETNDSAQISSVHTVCVIARVRVASLLRHSTGRTIYYFRSCGVRRVYSSTSARIVTVLIAIV